MDFTLAYAIFPDQAHQDFYPSREQLSGILDIMRIHDFITPEDVKRCKDELNDTWLWDEDGYPNQDQNNLMYAESSLDLVLESVAHPNDIFHYMFIRNKKFSIDDSLNTSFALLCKECTGLPYEEEFGDWLQTPMIEEIEGFLDIRFNASIIDHRNPKPVVKEGEVKTKENEKHIRYSRMIYPSNKYKDFYPTRKQIITILKIMKKHEFISGYDLKRCKKFLSEFRWDKDGYLVQDQTIPRLTGYTLDRGRPLYMFLTIDAKYTLNNYYLYLYHRAHTIGGAAKTSFALIAQLITEYEGFNQDHENLVRLLKSPMILEISQVLKVKFISGLIPYVWK